MPETSISLIIPTHKRAHLLRRALQSVKTQVSSECVEIIVVSDHADLQTSQVCHELLGPNDTYIRRSGAPGPSASRNLGLELARGRYVFFLDDDDAWQSGFLNSFLTSESYRLGAFAYFNCRVVKEHRLADTCEILAEETLDFRDRLNEQVFVKNQIHMSCLAFPRHVIGSIRFDPFMRAYEDWEFLLAIFERQMPRHEPILASRVYEVPDASTDRRGDHAQAKDFNAVLDYLYVYRRRPAPTPALAQLRSALLAQVGIPLAAELL